MSFNNAAAAQRLARSTEAGHPILDVAQGRCLELILIIIARTLFPSRVAEGSGPRATQLNAAFGIAWRRLSIHHWNYFGLYARPAFMAVYLILAVFKDHSLDGMEFYEPFEESAAEVIVRTFSLFYVVASKWQQDGHSGHITHTKFYFGEKNTMDQWYKRWVTDLERFLLPALDYNIAVTSTQWAPFLAYLFFLTRDDPGLTALHQPTLPTLLCLEGCSSSIAGQVHIPDRLAELQSMEEVRRDVVHGRRVVADAVPGFIRELCGDVARFRWAPVTRIDQLAVVNGGELSVAGLRF
ncbi:hypothetical protein CC1G_02573 [Coprinopsis cinerea okayama7|uniref:Uncharacterized protein n=1 Tax=Coprinopsis cinerea (strain Okayama-7 / 130 / ATCC MYA-4618 / FGSC 9003) TaxID=240176 RepID=A8PB69_COPC7|nr:hypothetical protein CC1G_02573 [Coprinopsis cinerea okayama7\|eukprot:XP_001840110.1 hypothetical protein CC1G_02573 [Coprinopsis cinerea okayama7\